MLPLLQLETGKSSLHLLVSTLVLGAIPPRSQQAAAALTNGMNVRQVDTFDNTLLGACVYCSCRSPKSAASMLQRDCTNIDAICRQHFERLRCDVFCAAAACPGAVWTLFTPALYASPLWLTLVDHFWANACGLRFFCHFKIPLRKSYYPSPPHVSFLRGIKVVECFFRNTNALSRQFTYYVVFLVLKIGKIEEKFASGAERSDQQDFF